MGCAAQKKQLTQIKIQDGQQAFKDQQFDNLINKIQRYKSLTVSRNPSPIIKSQISDIGPQIARETQNEELNNIKLVSEHQEPQEVVQNHHDFTPMFGINSPENKHQCSMTFSQSLQGSPSKQVHIDYQKQQQFRLKNKEMRKILKK